MRRFPLTCPVLLAYLAWLPACVTGSDPRSEALEERLSFVEHHALLQTYWPLVDEAGSDSALRQHRELLFAAVEPYSIHSRLGGADDYEPALGKLLDSQDMAVRGYAALTVGAARLTQFVPKLVKMMRTQTFKNRGKDAHQKAEITLQLKALGRFDRAAAAIALGLMQQRENTKDFVALTKSRDPSVRSGGVLALSYLGDRANRGAVAALKNDAHATVRKHAEQAYAALSPPVPVTAAKLRYGPIKYSGDRQEIVFERNATGTYQCELIYDPPVSGQKPLNLGKNFKCTVQGLRLECTAPRPEDGNTYAIVVFEARDDEFIAYETVYEHGTRTPLHRGNYLARAVVPKL